MEYEKDIPVEIWTTIFSYFSVENLIKLRNICATFEAIINNMPVLGNRLFYSILQRFYNEKTPQNILHYFGVRDGPVNICTECKDFSAPVESTHVELIVHMSPRTCTHNRSATFFESAVDRSTKTHYSHYMKTLYKKRLLVQSRSIDCTFSLHPPVIFIEQDSKTMNTLPELYKYDPVTDCIAKINTTTDIKQFIDNNTTPLLYSDTMPSDGIMKALYVKKKFMIPNSNSNKHILHSISPGISGNLNQCTTTMMHFKYQRFTKTNSADLIKRECHKKLAIKKIKAIFHFNVPLNSLIIAERDHGLCKTGCRDWMPNNKYSIFADIKDKNNPSHFNFKFDWRILEFQLDECTPETITEHMSTFKFKTMDAVNLQVIMCIYKNDTSIVECHIIECKSSLPNFNSPKIVVDIPYIKYGKTLSNIQLPDIVYKRVTNSFMPYSYDLINTTSKHDKSIRRSMLAACKIDYKSPVCDMIGTNASLAHNEFMTRKYEHYKLEVEEAKKQLVNSMQQAIKDLMKISTAREHHHKNLFSSPLLLDDYSIKRLNNIIPAWNDLPAEKEATKKRMMLEFEEPDNRKKMKRTVY